MPPGWKKSTLAGPRPAPTGGTGRQRESTTTESRLSPLVTLRVISAEKGRYPPWWVATTWSLMLTAAFTMTPSKSTRIRLPGRCGSSSRAPLKCRR